MSLVLPVATSSAALVDAMVTATSKAKGETFSRTSFQTETFIVSSNTAVFKNALSTAELFKERLTLN